jgi:hypothetical protein
MYSTLVATVQQPERVHVRPTRSSQNPFPLARRQPQRPRRHPTQASAPAARSGCTHTVKKPKPTALTVCRKPSTQKDQVKRIKHIHPFAARPMGVSVSNWPVKLETPTRTNTGAQNMSPCPPFEPPDTQTQTHADTDAHTRTHAIYFHSSTSWERPDNKFSNNTQSLWTIRSCILSCLRKVPQHLNTLVHESADRTGSSVPTRRTEDRPTRTS